MCLVEDGLFSVMTHICFAGPSIIPYSLMGDLSNSQHKITLRWRYNGRDSVSNHQPHDCLLNRLFRRRSKKTSKLRVTGLCAGKSPGTGEFPAQMASSAENVSIWWRRHEWLSAWVQLLHCLRSFCHRNDEMPFCNQYCLVHIPDYTMLNSV